VEHLENIVGGWLWQILGAICTVVTAIEPGENFFCQVNSARFHRLPISQISKFEHSTAIGKAMKTFGTEF